MAYFTVLTLWVLNKFFYFVPSAEYVYIQALLHNTTSECRLLSTYTYVTALDPRTSTLVAFSTRPLTSTFADICTQRVKIDQC